MIAAAASGIAEATVFRGRLDRVTWVTQALPVRSIPEQHLVASVRNNVIKVSSRSSATAGLAVNAERVLGQIACPRLLPLVVIPTLGAGAALLLGWLVLRGVRS